MKERLRKVERFEELRAGMIVVFTSCACHRARCRTMLIAALPSFWAGGATGFVWDRVPECHPEVAPIGPEEVAEGIVYAVDIGQGRPTTTVATDSRPRRQKGAAAPGEPALVGKARGV
jgi:hypothetical protein